MWSLLSVVLGAALGVAAPALAGDASATSPDVLLVTLDTTRADAIGPGGATTPVLDRLSVLGTRYRTAVTPAPLTLPAHATILTGLEPPEHGVRSNGGEALAATTPTLASVFADAGWRTAAVVGSRILDRRFGLARSFELYDDTMPAEQIGEYGYPERDARAVTDAALGWLATRRPDEPLFLWVHYYDPHAPYTPPAGFGGVDERAAYLGEVAFVDQQIGRLLRGLPKGLGRTLVVVVGDHGEALGDHGERAHGIFLYRATVEVPLIVAGPAVAQRRTVDGPVGLARVAPSVLRLAGLTENPVARRPALPLPGGGAAAGEAVYAEATMPRTAYGWAPLRSVTADGLKLILAPRPELYDLAADPGEGRNLAASRPNDVSRLSSLLDGMAASWGDRPAPAPELDGDTRAALRSLGYVEGAAPGADDGIDPKDGIAILGELDEATRQLRSGRVEAALGRLAALVRRNPGNGPLQTRYGEALLVAGERERAIAAYREAAALRPHSEFARRNLGEALLASGRTDEAAAVYAEVLEIDPRSAPAWLRLADLATGDQRVTVLRRAAAAGTGSAAVWLRLAAAELASSPEASLEACRSASELAPLSAEAALCLGRAFLGLDDPRRAAPHLQRAAVLGRGTATAEAAAGLLAGLTGEKPR